ncbi:hypothetical protein [Zunongwangia sp. HRR-M8]|uniref:hypothetical protein n=1 Tax=Zunongwangia sp. HRR-M8 TaxID=3015170 RepID=UPI0022DD571D|nr:hypothetical protein [Zunongwangia sp. HRR-M8]WBL21172.1 hypothetical protein PBT89_10545 [Zunongwangia sp. HRR-M8]
MKKVCLYEFEDPAIKISMHVYFNADNQLLFDGYDIGKRVKEGLGDSDYEYQYIIAWEEAKKLAHLFNCKENDKAAILEGLKKRFNTNDAYSKFGDYMIENNVVFEQFVWH